jgi:hypothetical protein
MNAGLTRRIHFLARLYYIPHHDGYNVRNVQVRVANTAARDANEFGLAQRASGSSSEADPLSFNSRTLTRPPRLGLPGSAR